MLFTASVIFPLGCAPPPNKYFLGSVNKVKGVIPYDKQTSDRFEANRNAERRCIQKKVKNSSQVTFVA
jgi:hypothetical protein